MIPICKKIKPNNVASARKIFSDFCLIIDAKVLVKSTLGT